MDRLYIVRHGQTVANVQQRYAGQSETPLTEQGMQDAKAAGQAAQALGLDVIISSPLSRAHDTAKIIAAEIDYPEEKIILSDLLKERFYGHFQGLSWELSLDDSPDVETIEAVMERARQIVARVKSMDAEAVLLVSHGTFAKVIRHVVNPGFNPNYNDADTELKNGEILQLI